MSQVRVIDWSSGCSSRPSCFRLWFMAATKRDTAKPNNLKLALSTNQFAPPSTFPALIEQAIPLAVIDFISTCFLVMGLKEILVFPDWNPRLTLPLQLVRLGSKSTKILTAPPTVVPISVKVRPANDALPSLPRVSGELSKAPEPARVELIRRTNTRSAVLI